MRYKGSVGGNGFPTLFGKPTWFVVPKMFAKAIIESREEHRKKEIEKTLKNALEISIIDKKIVKKCWTRCKQKHK